ncbi:G-protein coupled receptor dmsr-1-like [Planococcus citri]|uniref:G-protein coupled receptor dmsr-1-like n=1 Tax=Planococcus citri TaxID=170843 RepID=UPI0031F88FE8
MPSEEPFCGATLENVRTYYFLNLQGLIDIPICIIGVIFNMFNMLVFTRRNMISPVNLIFMHLAFANLSELLAFITSTWAYLAYHSKQSTYEDWTYTRAFVLMSSAELTSIFNRISAYIVMMLVIWKYIAVFHPSKGSQWCNMKTTRNMVVTGYIVCVLLYIPEYLSHYIKTLIMHPTTTVYLYSIETHSIMYSASQFIKIVLHELLPSLVLLILGVRLIVSLWMKKEHPTPTSNVENRSDNVEMKQQTSRSIIISLVIVAQCLSVEIPTGSLDLVARIVSAVDYYSIHYECVTSFKVILYLLDCVNKSIKFIVYFAMDQDFRDAFKSLFNKNNAFFWKLKYVPLSSTIGNDESLEIDRI